MVSSARGKCMLHVTLLVATDYKELRKRSRKMNKGLWIRADA